MPEAFSYDRGACRMGKERGFLPWCLHIAKMAFSFAQNPYSPLWQQLTREEYGMGGSLSWDLQR